MALEPGIDPCTHCGACFSFCEWDITAAAGGDPGPEICRACQTCYRICPRLPHDAAALGRSLFRSAQEAAWGPGRVLTLRGADYRAWQGLGP